jgi:hypothetical protein
LWAGISVVLPLWAITKQGAFMKNIKLLAIIAIVAVFGFSFTACGPEDDGEGILTGDERVLTITGIPTEYSDLFGYVAISGGGVSADSLPEKITSNNLRMDLYDMDNKWFTGSGDFMVVFAIITSENTNSEEIYSGYYSSLSITNATPQLSFIDLTPTKIENGAYVITGTSPTFKATKNGTALPTTGAIQEVINAIRVAANGEDIIIKFGMGTATLNVGTGLQNIEFKNEDDNIWGLITFKGKINGATAGGTGEPRYFYLLDILENVSATSSADITNTAHSPIRKFNAGTLTITGGTITGASGFIGVLVNGPTTTTTVNIQGGTITAGIGASSSAMLNISGGTITGTGDCAVEINTGTDRLNISGGTIRGIGNARGILISNGVVTLSNSPIITSETTAEDRATIQLGETATSTNTNNPALTIGADVIITNTGTNGKLVLNSNTAAPWKIVDSRANPPGGNLSN